VVAAFGQLLPQSVLEIPPHGCINVHPSLLPKFRGAAPVAGVILAGDDFTGVSIMLLDKGMDTGPVLTRVQIPVSPGDTTGSLTGKLAQVGAKALQGVLPAWVRGELVPQPQNDAEASYTSPIAKDAGRIDWQMPAVEIWRRVRAFSPWPGCYTVWQGKRLRIIEAGVLSPGITGAVGEVIAWEKSACGIITGEGVLGIVKVQLEGKQIVPVADFLRGHRQFIGTVLASV
jgi:methionyl-tRNA formyltransferase